MAPLSLAAAAAVILGLSLLDDGGQCSPNARGQPADGSEASGFDELLGTLISLAAGQRPNNENGTAGQFKLAALADHSNDAIFNSTSQEIIERSGFEHATHRVVSDDGYITQIINIINPLADRARLRWPPVVFFHGAFSDSASWICVHSIQHHPEKYPRSYARDGPITSANVSLAFTLANSGFDVWLADTRGSGPANMGHTRLKGARLVEDLWPSFTTTLATGGGGGGGKSFGLKAAVQFIDTLKYYDYSMDELVEFEYPRQIDAVLRLTGSRRVSVVAFSLGTACTFKLLASNRAYARRIHSYVAIGPLLDANGTSRLMEYGGKLAQLIPNPMGTLLLESMLTSSGRAKARKWERYTTYKMQNTLLGGSSPQFLTRLEDPFVGHWALPTSFKEVKHYFQETPLSRLQKFDYGPLRNGLVYAGAGGRKPPIYELSRIKIKRWMLVTAANDILGTASSGRQYARELKWKPYKLLNIESYNHLDLLAAFDVDEKVNLPVLEFFQKFSSPAKPVSSAKSPVKSPAKSPANSSNTKSPESSSSAR